MRRWAVVAAFALVIAVPASWGQMRGGMRAAPAARGGGFSRGFSSRAGFTSAPRGVPSGASHHSGWSVHGCWNCGHNHFHHGGYPWWWARFGYPYYAYPYYSYYGYAGYWPMTWDDSSYGSSEDSDNQRALASQVDQLSQEVQDLRDELRATRAANNGHPPQQVQPSQSQATPSQPQTKSQSSRPENTRPDMATVLVFRDQRIQEVKNYAIVGQTLVIVADQRAKKIPLADLDLQETSKLNEERGVYFAIPQ